MRPGDDGGAGDAFGIDVQGFWGALKIHLLRDGQQLVCGQTSVRYPEFPPQLAIVPPLAERLGRGSQAGETVLTECSGLISAIHLDRFSNCF